MPLPASWTTVAVTWTITGHDGTPAKGVVRFTSAQVVTADGGTYVPAPITARVTDGVMEAVSLPTTDDPDISPTGWTWRVQPLTSPDGPEAFNILVPAAGGPINLATVVPVSSPTPLSAVAIGDQFIAGRVNDATSVTRTALDAAYVAMVPKPTGIAATDTANIQSKIDAALAFGISTVRLHAGTYRTNAPLAIGDNLVIEGAGREATAIRNAVSDVFSWSATGSAIRDLSVFAEAGAGHIFLQSGLVKRCQFENLHLDQANDSKSVYSSIVDNGNYLFNTWQHVTPRHTNTATVPTFHFIALTSAGAVNANTWEDMDPTRSGNYSFWFESARSSNYIYDNVLRDIRFEQADGGCVKLLGTDGVKLENHTIYDYLAPTRVPYYVGRGTHADSPTSNRNLTVSNLLFASTPGAFPHIQFQSVDGGVAPAEDTLLIGCGTHLGNITVDFGNNIKVTTVGSRITRVNGDRVVSYGPAGPRLAPATYLHGATGTTGVGIDAAGGAQTYGPHDVGAGANQVLNSEFDTDIRQWTDGGAVLSYATNAARLQNASGTFINVTGACASALTGGQIYKVVLKLRAVTAFPAPTTSLRLFDGATYQMIANTTSEQTLYQTLGSGGVVLRTGDGLDVELDYLRVYPVTGAAMLAHGPLVHRGSTAGFYGSTPIAKPAALTAADGSALNTGDATSDTVIANMRTRIGELESRLRSLGLLT